MKVLKQAIRDIKKLCLCPSNEMKRQKSMLRCMSLQTESKIIHCSDGKKIIPSIVDKISYPEISISEYVWMNVKDFHDKTALVCSITDRKYTYAQTRDMTNYVARSLVNMGLRKGDTVALMLPNLPEYAIAFLGILEADLLVTTFNPYYTVNEIQIQLNLVNAKAIITSTEIASTIQLAIQNLNLTKIPFIVVDDKIGSVPEGSILFQDLITRGKTLPSLPSIKRSIDDTAIIPFSSGTTGLPKGVMLSHRNIISNMEMVDNCLGKKIVLETTDTFQDVIPLMLPCFHIYGMNAIMLPYLRKGLQLVTLPKFTPDLFVKVLEKYKPTILFCVPPTVLFLSVSPLIKKHHLQSIRTSISGAAPLSKQDVDRLYEKFQLDSSSLHFSQGYGMTECSGVGFVELHGTKYASIGKNVSGSEVRLVDPITNKDISTYGQTGEIFIKGPHIMKGYLNNEKATKEILSEDGWLKTGDIAYFDEDLDFFITDRLKELIKVKGFQVAPTELESLLRTHPDVEDAAVIGIPNVRSGEVPKAFILPKKNKKLSEEEIKNFVKEKVSEYKRLAGGIVFVDEIPKSPSGKILKKKLKEMYL